MEAPPGLQRPPQAPSPVAFREVRHSGWLRRLQPQDAPAPSPGGAWTWFELCVHEARAPFLEAYGPRRPVPAAVGGHRPEWRAPLAAARHVAPAISAPEHCELEVVAAEERLRFAAPDWTAVTQWVGALRSTLAELRIVAPVENAYSAAPAPRRPLAATRDPNSPLPPPPGAQATPPEPSPGPSRVPAGTSGSGPAATSGEYEWLCPEAAPLLTVRAAQVARLEREMRHPGGVRLQLRAERCRAAVAFVDACDAVWVAGWNQREMPTLQGALHVGDQLLTVAGVRPLTATAADEILRLCASPIVEVVVRRVPLGRALAVRREGEGWEGAGLSVGGGGEVKGVRGAAARAGLAAQAATPGGGRCNWVLTEVNGRPLGLFCGAGEARRRLGAVGADLALLLQPLHLVARLRKRLTALPNHKRFLLQ